MILEAQTHIDADPDQVFRYFENMEDNYTDWHPAHITFRWVDGDGLAQGSTSYFEEEIGGEVMKKTVRYASVEPGRRIELQPTARLLRLILPYITFTFEPDDGGCLLTQRLKVRTGPIGRRLNRSQFRAVKRHMREEGENLKAIMEEDDSSTPSAA